MPGVQVLSLSCYWNQTRLTIICQHSITNRQSCIQHLQWHSSICIS